MVSIVLACVQYTNIAWLYTSQFVPLYICTRAGAYFPPKMIIDCPRWKNDEMTLKIGGDKVAVFMYSIPRLPGRCRVQMPFVHSYISDLDLTLLKLHSVTTKLSY